MKKIEVICPYCEKKAELVDSRVIYSKSYGMVYLCKDCDAWVGCHKNSKNHAPLGRLANSELRKWKIKAHSMFDRLWMKKMALDNCSKGRARAKAYKWLAGQMNIPAKECHIGMFDVDRCKVVVEICGKINKRRRN